MPDWQSENEACLDEGRSAPDAGERNDKPIASQHEKQLRVAQQTQPHRNMSLATLDRIPLDP